MGMIHRLWLRPLLGYYEIHRSYASLLRLFRSHWCMCKISREEEGMIDTSIARILHAKLVTGQRSQPYA
jgi:hypothetical protein